MKEQAFTEPLNRPYVRFVCDECLKNMGSIPYATIAESTHLCWECCGTAIMPDRPTDPRRFIFLVDQPQPQKKVKKSVQQYQTCVKHAVPCKNSRNHSIFDFHPFRGPCCYYCCETCKSKCPDPVTQQMRPPKKKK